VKSWTRTLNLDDAHTLLAYAEPGSDSSEWSEQCHAMLPKLSLARRRELIRMLRDGFLELDDNSRILEGTFLERYRNASAVAQVDLVQFQWALSHPLSLIAAERLVAPALDANDLDIPLEHVERLVSEHLSTSSAESRRKTRTVLLGALEGIGVLETRGTGQHRALRAARGRPHPLTFGYLVLRDLADRGLDGMMAPEVTESSLGVRLTQCGVDHARACLQWNLSRRILVRRDDEIGIAR
jgi:hypothetical protein